MKSAYSVTTRLRTASAALIAAAALTGPAVAQEIRFANPQSDANAVSVGIAAYIEAVNASSDLTLRRFGGALLQQPEVAAGLRDGIVGMGFLVPAYLPAEFAEFNLMANLSMLVTSGTPTDAPIAASAGAMMEYVFFNCPGCLQEFARQNMVFLSSGSTNPYDLLCRGSVSTLADLPGRRIRSGAANFTRWAQAMGATTVSMDSTEVFDAMSQGVLDCNMLSFGDMISNGLADLVDSVIFGVPGGVFSGFASNTANLDTWRSLTTEQRAALLEHSPGLAADITLAQIRNHNNVLAAVEGTDMVLSQADDALRAATDAFVQQDLAVIIAQFTNQYGIADVAAKVELAASLIERWKGLTAGIGNDRNALAALFQREIFSRLDPATYGLN